MTNNQINQTTGETKINHLFVQFEKLHHLVNFWNDASINNPSPARDQIFEETIADHAICQKRIIRALLTCGLVGELESHVRVGTFPRYAIHAAFGRV